MTFTKVGVQHSSWTVPTHHARFQPPSYYWAHPLALILPAALIPQRLQPPGLEVPLWQTYGNIYCTLEALGYLH